MQKQKAKNRVRGFERLESRCLLSSVWVQSGTLTLTSSDSLAAGSALYVGAGGTLLFDPTAAPVGAPTGAVIADGAQVYTTGSPLGPTTYLNGSIVQDTSTVNGSPFTTLNQYLGNSSTQVTPATIPDPPPAPADQNSYSGGTISVASGVATIAAGSWAGIPQGDYSTTGLTLTIPPQAVVYNTGTVDVDNGTVTLSGGSWANVPQNNVTLVLTEGGTSRAYQVSSLTAGGCTILPASSEQIPPGTTDDFWLSSTDADYTLSWDTAPAATYQVNSLDPSGGTCTLSDLSGNPITDSSADCSNVNYTLSWPLAGGDAWAPTLTFNTGAAQPTDPPGPPQPTIWASDTASLGFLTNTPTGASGAVGANTSVSVIPPTTVGQATSDGTVAPSPGNAGGASVSQTVNIQLTPVSQADALAGTSYNNAVASGYVNTVYNITTPDIA